MNKVIALIIVVLVILVGAFFVFQKGGEEQTLPAGETATVSYNDSGFSPNSINIKAGGTVTFINNSSKQMWVASAFHPTHQALPGFDQLQGVGNGGIYQYTFTKSGQWGYHNHLSPGNWGTVIAQ